MITEAVNNTVPLTVRPAPQHVAEPSIGALLLEAGKITAEDAERVLRHQKERGLRFGEAAVELKICNDEDIRQVLARQFQYPYLQAGEGNYPPFLVAAYSPFTPEVESLRNLRSQLMLRWFETGRRGLAVIGLGEDGGAASRLTSNLAVVFSQLGEQTLVVDGNLRNPSQHSTFNLTARQGLSDILAQRGSEETVRRIEDFLNLSVLPAGTTPPNPQELLNRSLFNDLNSALSARFDVVLYDTPPVALGSDGYTIASRVGGAVLVARKNKARLNELRDAAAMLKQNGAAVVGTVLVEG